VPRGAYCIASLYGIGLAFAVAAACLMALPGGQRLVEVVQNTCAMSFAWCFLWSTRWLAMRWSLLRQLIDTPASMEGRILLALVLSSGALAVIFVLDTVEDFLHESAGHMSLQEVRRVSRIIQIIINALSILVGFTWEHSFDGGVEAVASTTDHPVTMKMCMTAVVAVVIIPAWRRFILVKVLNLADLRKERLHASAMSSEGEGDETEPLTARGAE